MSNFEKELSFLWNGGELKAGDFPRGSVFIEFEDGSKTEFKHSFYKSDGNIIAVFTEHCGYHEFPALGSIVNYDEGSH